MSLCKAFRRCQESMPSIKRISPAAAPVRIYFKQSRLTLCALPPTNFCREGAPTHLPCSYSRRPPPTPLLSHSSASTPAPSSPPSTRDTFPRSLTPPLSAPCMPVCKRLQGPPCHRSCTPPPPHPSSPRFPAPPRLQRPAPPPTPSTHTPAPHQITPPVAATPNPNPCLYSPPKP